MRVCAFVTPGLVRAPPGGMVTRCVASYHVRPNAATRMNTHLEQHNADALTTYRPKPGGLEHALDTHTNGLPKPSHAPLPLTNSAKRT